MSAFAPGREVEHHETLLGHGGLHARGFAHDGHVDRGHQRECPGDAVLSGHLLFGRCQIDEVMVTGHCGQDAKRLQERHQSAAAVVAAQSVEGVALAGGGKRVARPRSHRFHGVDVGIEQHRGALFVEVWGYGPQIVSLASGSEAVGPEGGFHEVGGSLLVAAYRRGGDEVA